MSTAIRDVSDTLIQLLRTEVGPLLPDPDLIALLSPAEANSIGVRLTLFLYSISPAAEYRNELEIAGASMDNLPISMPVNLYYLLTAFSPPQDPTNRSLDSHLLLGRAMRVFFDNGTLLGSSLKGDLPRDEPLHVSLQPITVEDLTRIWSVFPETALQPSVSYLVTPVRLRAGRIREGAPVVSRQTDADHVVPVQSPDEEP
jgi:Pvc16 N-terminal domain